MVLLTFGKKIVINQCLLSVVFSITKALNFRNSPKQNFHPLPFKAIRKTASLFHFKLYEISPDSIAIVISWQTAIIKIMNQKKFEIQL